MRKIEHIMGMPISVDIPLCSDREVFSKVFEHFQKLDEQYSTYKQSSEVSRYNQASGHGEWSEDLQNTLIKCQEFEELTNGYFSAFYGDGFDPSGYIKARAIKESSDSILRSGFERFMINAAGDIFASSDFDSWTIGLQNPIEKNSILAEVVVKTGGIATSGTYKRGQHIFNPKTQQPAQDTLSLSIIGPDIVLADVLATAGCAMSPEQAIEFLNQLPEYKAILIDKDQNIFTTDNFSI